MKNSGGKRSVDAAALRSKLAELEGLRAELQAKYDKLLAEREALKQKAGDKATVQTLKASEKVSVRKGQVRTAKRKSTTSVNGHGKTELQPNGSARKTS